MLIKSQTLKNDYGRFQDWTITQVGASAFKVSAIFSNGTRCGQSFTTLADAENYLSKQGKPFSYVPMLEDECYEGELDQADFERSMEDSEEDRGSPWN